MPLFSSSDGSHSSRYTSSRVDVAHFSTNQETPSLSSAETSLLRELQSLKQDSTHSEEILVNSRLRSFIDKLMQGSVGSGKSYERTCDKALALAEETRKEFPSAGPVVLSPLATVLERIRTTSKRAPLQKESLKALQTVLQSYRTYKSRTDGCEPCS
eukprot:Protomagalhaensia_sp_Gyna_25__4834@NODE_499_length_3264_cov_94_544496_g390_i0_p3_GENE_NODE_499_length_3264_cov_94_544496_g390_i0NODE_499_length_3264_cov_94_544496_g390_i0_p3_ORF_typecomplete_len157_score27_02Leptin/PF02024_15/0_49Leptin/PF02024_15/1_9e02Leptin/PF02024_15/1_3e03_NODE_499_length_3264_cov_94_544496_g390_i09051375